ncbi:MAG: family hydrolase [Mucilaginibacter sp.]|nr:family hydrolase [Mucilaginibacter sp.]
MKADSLIFDLDGTLWDASASCVMAWNKALEKKGIKDFRITEQLAFSFAGKLLDEIFTQYFTFLPPDQYNDMAMAYAEQEAFHMKNYGGHLYPNAKEELILLAKTYPLFIVSNCLAGYIENFLHQHGLESVFTDFECSGLTGKPKAENIAMIISRNQLESPVYIGDTLGDFEAAKQNRMPFIHAAYGFGKVSENKYKINNLKQLENVLKTII